VPVNRRINPFTLEEMPANISGESHTVPSGAPYWVWLDEIPLEESPGSVTVWDAANNTDIQPDGAAGSDAYIYEDTPTTNQGSAIILVTGREGGPAYGRYRSLLQFDLSGLPAGDVTQATLRLYMEAGGGGYPAGNQVGVHEVTEGWAEGTVTYASQPAHEPVAEDVVTATASGWYDWDVTTLAAAWVAGSKTNNGLMLKHADEVSATDTSRNWTSSDSATAANRPMLRVSIAGTSYTIVAQATTPGVGEVALSYPFGALNFHSSAAGNTISVDYKGTGSPVRVEDLA